MILHGFAWRSLQKQDFETKKLKEKTKNQKIERKPKNTCFPMVFHWKLMTGLVVSLQDLLKKYVFTYFWGFGPVLNYISRFSIKQ